jgi:hypothetical protein
MTTETKSKPISLLERIEAATTDQELFALYTEGEGYRYAADKTRRRWSTAVDAGRKRIAQEAKAKVEKDKPKPKSKPQTKSKGRR